MIYNISIIHQTLHDAYHSVANAENSDVRNMFKIKILRFSFNIKKYYIIYIYLYKVYSYWILIVLHFHLLGYYILELLITLTVNNKSHSF